MGDSYAPRSPDLSAYHSAPAPPLQQSPYYPPQPKNTYAPAYIAAQHQPPFPTEPFPLSPTRTRRSADMDPNDDEWMPDQPDQAGARGGRGRKSKKAKLEPDYGTKPAPGTAEGIEVKTKFPVARIKRIMQADEDVGKVAQVTPTAVSKALELFMISLVTKSAARAREKSSKKVTAAHLKQVVEQDEQFDFLADIISKVPDAPTKKEKEDDSEGAGESKRKRAPRRRKLEEED